MGRVGRRQINEGGCHLAPVAKFEGALSQTAASDNADGVGGATVDFDEGDETLAVAAARLLYAETLAAQHGHADAENLAGTEVAVSSFGHRQEFVKGFHYTSDATP
jgi:hypothetical protein